MDRRLIETLKRNSIPLVGGEFIDSYNQLIKRDGIAGTVYSSINQCGHTYIVGGRKRGLMEEIHTKVVCTLDIKGRHESALRVHDPNYISPSVITHTGGGHEPKIITPCDFRYDEGLREREC